ncbi:MAG: cyclic nucleotide-binding domain-containing protein [Verrucomicrobiota bacterium]
MKEAMDNKVDKLRQVTLFSWLDEEKIDTLAANAQPHDFEAGDVCLAKGSATRGVHILISGSVEVFEGESRSPHDILFTLIDGDFFGEQCLLGNSSSAGTFVALEPCSLLFISLEFFKELEKDHPDQYALIISNLARFYSRTLRQVNERFKIANTVLAE